MAQADGVVANGTGSAVRADINGQLAALFTNHSGSTEPATTFAFQTWADTNTSTLKLRNSSNDGWIQLARLDGQFDAKTFNGNITLNAQSDLRLADSDSSNWVAFQAPATVASNVTWTLPAADGTSGQTLQTNGSGTLSWSTPSASVDIISEGNTSAEVVDTGSDGHFKVITEGTEALRVDASRRLLVGTTSTRDNWFNTTGQSSLIQSESATVQNVFSGTYTASGGGATIFLLGKARGSSYQVVNSDDGLGRFSFQGADGSQMVEAASIIGEVDGTPGANDMPGRLLFNTTADGASSPTERLRIAQSGAIGLSGANYGTSGQVLTSQGSGSAPQWATPAGGKILQVVHSTKTTATFITPGTTWTDTGVSVNITPSSTSSKVLIIWQCRATSENRAYLALAKGGSILNVPTSIGSRIGCNADNFYYNGDGYWVRGESATYLDSPSSTSTLTYAVYGRHATSGSEVMRINYSYTDANSVNYGRSTSSITAMEVSA